MQTKDNKMRNKRLIYDAILVLALLVVSLSAFLVLRFLSPSGRTVVVSVDGEVSAEYSLDTNGIYELNGGTNVLVIADGEAYLKSADCPDKLCVNQGKIRSGGQSIVCLPNKVVITVK